MVPPEWRKWPLFDNIFTLKGVPVITVQLRYNGWVTELQDPTKIRELTKVTFYRSRTCFIDKSLAMYRLSDILPMCPLRCVFCMKHFPLVVQGAQGMDNLLYSADADFSCFADLAVTSPVEYYKEGQGSLLQCVLTPADPYMPLPNEEIAAKVHEQASLLFSGFSIAFVQNLKNRFSTCVSWSLLAWRATLLDWYSGSVCCLACGSASCTGASFHVVAAGLALVPLSKGAGGDVAFHCEDRAVPLQ